MLFVLEWIFIVLVGLVLLTQVILPAFTNWPLFWLFRKNLEKRLAYHQEQLSQCNRLLEIANTELDRIKLEGMIAELEEKIRQTKEKKDGNA